MIGEVTHFQSDLFSKRPIFAVIEFEVTQFRSDLFSTRPFFEVIGFEVTHFRSDRFWNEPFCEVINFRTEFFQIEILLQNFFYKSFSKSNTFLCHIFVRPKRCDYLGKCDWLGDWTIWVIAGFRFFVYNFRKSIYWFKNVSSVAKHENVGFEKRVWLFGLVCLFGVWLLRVPSVFWNLIFSPNWFRKIRLKWNWIGLREIYEQHYQSTVVPKISEVSREIAKAAKFDAALTEYEVLKLDQLNNELQNACAD